MRGGRMTQCVRNRKHLELCPYYMASSCNRAGLRMVELLLITDYKDVIVKIDDFELVEPGEEALMREVAKQPVAVPVDVCPYFKGFQGNGIIEYADCPPAAEGDPGKCAHAILVVGYGTDEDGKKYWKVKNNWGTWWGNKGYAKLRRGVADKRGVAGITSYFGQIPIIN